MMNNAYNALEERALAAPGQLQVDFGQTDAPDDDDEGAPSGRGSPTATLTSVSDDIEADFEKLLRMTVPPKEGRYIPDLKADGDIGPATRSALTAFLRARGGEGEVVLLKALNVLQGERYISLAEGRAANESFLYGWLRTRVEIVA